LLILTRFGAGTAGGPGGRLCLAGPRRSTAASARAFGVSAGILYQYNALLSLIATRAIW